MAIGTSIIALVLTVGSALGFAKPALNRYEYSQVRMGGKVSLVFYAEADQIAETAARAVFDRLEQLEQIASDYRADSELNRLCQSPVGRAVKLSKELFELLSFARKVSQASDGAFDVTCGRLTTVWRSARRRGSLPTSSEIARALKGAGYKNLALNPARRTATLSASNIRLDLGGVAKGFACHEGLKVFDRFGVRSAMIWAGGDIAASNAPPAARGWRVSIAGVRRGPIYLANAALSTSGDTEQFLDVDGVRYSHIVDPRTGHAITNRVQATVLARRGITADAIATTCCILQAADAHRLAAKFKAELILVHPK